MRYERSFKRTATVSTIGKRRAVSFAPAFSDARLQVLGEAIRSALGDGFIRFEAKDAEATHDIVIEWTDLDKAAEVAAIDDVFSTWLREEQR